MLRREDWLPLARKLDWEFTYVSERDVFPEAVSGTPWLEHAAWQGWDEPYRTSFAEYASLQHQKELRLAAIREAVGRVEDFQRLDRGWLSAVKLHAATFALAEFAAVMGNLRAARFGRDSAWRSSATFGALDELRHTQIPLTLLHDLVRWDVQFDWAHKLFHTNNWVSIAARHLADELLLTADPIEFAVATHFVFETGFTNLQFVGLSALARDVGDRAFELMLQSIQTDEARHSQIGDPVLETLIRHDPARAQRLVDKWFWRSWLFFAVVTGFAMDYLTPLEHRKYSFKEFVEEWIVSQFAEQLARQGLSLPWYWSSFLSSVDYYHHMLYASAYTHRASLWFDCVLPGPRELEWLRGKYPESFGEFEPIWHRVAERQRQAGPGVEWFTHGTTPVTFCDLCQLVLCGGRPQHNSARTLLLNGRRYIFCSEPCAWIFETEPERYAAHKSVVGRILAGEAPANLLELLRSYFGLDASMWGKDAARGAYGWLESLPAARGACESGVVPAGGVAASSGVVSAGVVRAAGEKDGVPC
ncbi:MAG TPA: YHS domain-containing protein [Polyangiaceae bacterium]|nr:YHS domain-containing protein [Polyangiaceae bacterium]